MSMRLSIAVVTLLLCLVSGGMAQATYYHFEDYGAANVSFTTGSTFTWAFDLDEDNMGLWVIPNVPLTSGGTDWGTPTLLGSMNPEDDLHQAYLTMKFTGVNDLQVEEIDFTLDLTDTLSWFLSQGGLPNQVIPNLQLLPDDQNAPGTLNVFSYLKDDHFLYVMIESIKGDFIVEKMNLAGCYETGPVPVPEPGSLALLGVGLVALLAVVSRRRL